MRISKTIKGELYHFYAQFTGDKKAKVRYFQTNEYIICDLSECFNYILLPKGKFVFNNVNVEKLKLNKAQRFEALDFNNITSIKELKPKLNLSDIFDNNELLVLDKLKKINKIARSVRWYYTGFGLPVESDEQIIKHSKEIKMMIKVFK